LVGDHNTDIAKISSAGEVQWVPEDIYRYQASVCIRKNLLFAVTKKYSKFKNIMFNTILHVQFMTLREIYN
jgi:hypothetical protein